VTAPPGTHFDVIALGPEAPPDQRIGGGSA